MGEAENSTTDGNEGWEPKNGQNACARKEQFKPFFALKARQQVMWKNGWIFNNGNIIINAIINVNSSFSI